MDKQCFVNGRKIFLRKHCHVLQQKILFRGEYIYMVLKNKFISYSSVFNYELMPSSFSLSLSKEELSISSVVVIMTWIRHNISAEQVIYILRPPKGMNLS
jgi:hypothetical protein